MANYSGKCASRKTSQSGKEQNIKKQDKKKWSEERREKKAPVKTSINRRRLLLLEKMALPLPLQTAADAQSSKQCALFLCDLCPFSSSFVCFFPPSLWRDSVPTFPIALDCSYYTTPIYRMPLPTEPHRNTVESI